MCLLGQLYFSLLLLQQNRLKLLLCLHFCLLNQFQIQCAFREICLPCYLYPQQEILVTEVITCTFNLKYFSSRWSRMLKARKRKMIGFISQQLPEKNQIFLSSFGYHLSVSGLNISNLPGDPMLNIYTLKSFINTGVWAQGTPPCCKWNRVNSLIRQVLYYRPRI